MAGSNSQPTLQTLPDTVFAAIVSRKELKARDLLSLACSFKGARAWCEAEAKRRVTAFWDAKGAQVRVRKPPPRVGPDPDDSPDGEWPVLTKGLVKRVEREFKDIGDDERPDYRPALALMEPEWVRDRKCRPIKRPCDTWLRVLVCEEDFDSYENSVLDYYALVRDTAVLRTLLSSHARVEALIATLSESDRAALNRLCARVNVMGRWFTCGGCEAVETAGFRSGAEFCLSDDQYPRFEIENNFAFHDYFVGDITMRCVTANDSVDVATAKMEFMSLTGPAKVQLQRAHEVLQSSGGLPADVSPVALGAFLHAVLIAFEEMDFYGVPPEKRELHGDPPALCCEPTLRGWPSLFHANYETRLRVAQVLKFLRHEGVVESLCVNWHALFKAGGFCDPLYFEVDPRYKGWLLATGVTLPYNCGTLNVRALMSGDWTGASDDDVGDDENGSSD